MRGVLQLMSFHPPSSRISTQLSPPPELLGSPVNHLEKTNGVPSTHLNVLLLTLSRPMYAWQPGTAVHPVAARPLRWTTKTCMPVYQAVMRANQACTGNQFSGFSFRVLKHNSGISDTLSFLARRQAPRAKISTILPAYYSKSLGIACRGHAKNIRKTANYGRHMTQN